MLLKLIQKGQFNKTAEATGDLIGDKIANKITKVSRTSAQNNSEAVTNETENNKLDREVLRKKISPEKRQQIMDDVRLM